MVKSKKLSRGSLAVLLLALMLALSMVVGITGAWFTDSAVAPAKTVDFGTIDVAEIAAGDVSFVTARSIELSDSETENAMPGDTVTYTLKVTNAGENDFYYIVKVAYALSEGDLPAQFVGGLYIPAGRQDNLQSGKVAKKLEHGQNENVVIASVLPDSLGNSLQGKTVTVNATVYVMQAANITAADAYALLEQTANA